MLPLVLLYLWIVHGAVADKRAALETEALDRLATIAIVMEQKLDYANYVAYDVGDNANLRPARLQGTVQSQMQGITDLSKYTIADDFWKEIYYVIDGDDKVYSTRGIMDWNVMAQTKLHLSQAQSEQLRARVEELMTTAFVSESSSYGYYKEQILYLQSIRRPLVNYRGALMYQVNTESLLSILNIFDESMCGIYITDTSGNVLYSRLPNSAWPQEEILPQLSNVNGIAELRAGDRAFSGVSYASANGGWRYVAVIPTAIFFEEVMDMQMTVLTLLAVICLLGACLVVVLSWVNYKPIRIIRDIAVREMPELEERQLDELDAVREMVDHSLEQRSELELSIQRQKQQIVQQTLRLLLSGFKAEDMPILTRAMNAADIRLSLSRMCILLISRVDGVNPYGAAEAARLKASFDETHFQIYPYPRADLGALVIIASYEDGEQLQLARLLYQEALVLSEELVLAVSNECQELTQLAKALNQACSALGWARETAASGMVFFSDIDGTSDVLARLKKEYFQAVHQGDEERALLCAENLIGQVTANHSYEFARMVLCELIGELYDLSREYRAGLVEDGQTSAMRFSSFDELRTMFIHMTRELSQVVFSRRTMREAGRSEELLAFVDESYRNPDLSLKMLSDHFGMSPNYVSRIFRESAGKGFSEYVSDMRMQYVKNRLVASAEPIKDIILSAGYRDVPNFMRKFKQIVGSTPGEYRKTVLAQEDRDE